MYIRFCLIILLLINVHLSVGQQIEIYKTFGGYRFEVDTVAISPMMVLQYMQDNPQAHAEFKRAKANYNFAGGLSFTGGILIAIPIATAIGGGNPEWGLAAGGLGLILASIPFTTSFRHRALNAIDTYNSGLGSSKRIRTQFYFAGTGGKLVFRF